jgi:hypothetical protein
MKLDLTDQFIFFLFIYIISSITYFIVNRLFADNKASYSEVFTMALMVATIIRWCIIYTFKW